MGKEALWECAEKTWWQEDSATKDNSLGKFFYKDDQINGQWFEEDRQSRKTGAAAKSLQSCPTLCNPIDGSPPCSPVPGILQARTLEWVAISFSMHQSEKWKWSHSVVSDSSRPHGLQPTRLLHPWDFPGKSTGVGCHCLLRQKGYFIFKIGSNLGDLCSNKDAPIDALQRCLLSKWVKVEFKKLNEEGAHAHTQTQQKVTHGFRGKKKNTFDFPVSNSPNSKTQLLISKALMIKLGTCTGAKMWYT